MSKFEYGSIQIQSPAMKKVLQSIPFLNPLKSVFIIGENGVGKSTFAKYLYQEVYKNKLIPIVKNITKVLAVHEIGIYTVHSDQWLFIQPEIEDNSAQIIYLPTLSDRKADIPELADFFLQVLSLMHGKQKIKLTEKALEKIIQYSWPGQFYEFENVLENAFSNSENGLIEPELLQMGPLTSEIEIPMGMKLEDLERNYILQTLYFAQQNRTRAAEILGISIRTLRNKINLYRVEGYL